MANKQRMVEITLDTPAGPIVRAVLPKVYERKFADKGWKATKYEDGEEYVSKAEQEKRDAKERAKAAKAPAGKNAADSGDTDATAPGTNSGRNQEAQT